MTHILTHTGNERVEHMEQRVSDRILFAVKMPTKPYKCKALIRMVEKNK